MASGVGHSPGNFADIDWICRLSVLLYFTNAKY